jgi:uncharacterized protein (TIGR03086 family)
MALEPTDAHARALEQTRGFVAGVAPGQWGQPSPCEDWDVRGLVNHIVAGNFWVAPLLGGSTIAEVGDRYDGDLLGEDPLAAYDRSAVEAARAGRAPGAMSAPCAVSYGPVPGEVYLGHRLLDVLIHGWDVATATGQEATLDPELVEECWAVIEPQLEMLTQSGMFGHRVDVPADASPEVRLLAALGRRS